MPAESMLGRNVSIITGLLELLDRYTEAVGRWLAWLVPLMMLAICAVVLLRYGFGQGATALQESVTYLHATIFMLGAGFTLKRGGHVRVDIFYRNFSARRKAWVDSLGTLIFLFPLCGYILLSSWDFVLNSWAIREASGEPGGIPAVFLLKTLIPLMAIHLLIQGVAELLRNVLTLMEDDA